MGTQPRDHAIHCPPATHWFVVDTAGAPTQSNAVCPYLPHQPSALWPVSLSQHLPLPRVNRVVRASRVVALVCLVAGLKSPIPIAEVPLAVWAWFRADALVETFASPLTISDGPDTIRLLNA